MALSETNAANNPRIAAKVAKQMAEGGELEVIKGLTGLQVRFVEEFVKDFDGTMAVIRSGSKVANKSNASKMAFNYLGHPGIRIAIRYYTSRRVENSALDVNWVIGKWAKAIASMEEKGLEDPKAAGVMLRATELLAKHLGMFIERTEVTGKDGSAIQIEEINDAADAFARSITRIADRNREGTGSSPTAH